MIRTKRSPGHGGDGRRRRDGDLTPPAIVVLFLVLLMTTGSGVRAAGDWFTVVGGPHTDLGRAVEPLADGGYVVVGSGNPGGDESILVVRTDAEGVVLWERHVTRSNLPERGYGAVEAPDGTLFVLGAIERPESAESRPFLVQLTSEGEEIWNTEDSIVQGFPVNSHRVLGAGLAGGDLVLAGGGSEHDPGQRPWVAVVHRDRTVAAFRLLTLPNGGRGITGVHALAPTPDGGFLIGGEGSGAGYVWSFDQRAVAQWFRVFAPEEGPSVVRGVEPLGGGAVVVGDSKGVPQAVRLASGGHTMWRTLLPVESGVAEGRDVARVGVGLAVARVTYSALPGSPARTDLVELSVHGEVGTSTAIGGPELSVDIRQIADANGGWVATGHVQEAWSNAAPDLVLARGTLGNDAVVGAKRIDARFGAESSAGSSADSSADSSAGPTWRLRHDSLVAGTVHFEFVGGASVPTLTSLSIFDVHGHRVGRVRGDAGPVTVDLGGWPIGVYFVEARTTAGRITSRFVLRR